MLVLFVVLGPFPAFCLLRHRAVVVGALYLARCRFLLNFCISGLVQVECTEAMYFDNPEIQNSGEIRDLAVVDVGIDQHQ